MRPRDVAETGSALSAIWSPARVGHATLLAVVDERSPDAIDAVMTGVGSTVPRRSFDDVEADVVSAERAQREATREARQERLRPRHGLVEDWLES